MRRPTSSSRRVAPSSISTQRADAYSKFQTMVWNDAPWLFGYRAVTFIVHDAAIQDIKVLPGTEMPYFWEAHR